jgi:ATP-dependent protease HslVU (ClpYQ) peptidase subunit
VARYDKYDPIDGGFRAPLAADWLEADLNKVFAVGLDANGKVVKGAGNSGVKGVLVLSKVIKADKIVDVMTDGEVVEMDVNHAGIVAGTSYYGSAAGALTTVNTDKPIGHTVEATRLVVRVGS